MAEGRNEAGEILDYARSFLTVCTICIERSGLFGEMEYFANRLEIVNLDSGANVQIGPGNKERLIR